MSLTSLAEGKITIQLSGNPGQDVVLDRVSSLGGDAMWGELSTWVLGDDGRLSVEAEALDDEGYLRLRSP